MTLQRNPANKKQYAHQLIDRLDAEQLSAVVGLLEVMIDPVARKLANAPVDDEPESEQESQAVREAKQWLQRRGGKGIPHEEVVWESRASSPAKPIVE